MSLPAPVMAAAAGGALGYLYHQLVGCSTGACPLTANPYTSVLYGACLGLILSMR